MSDQSAPATKLAAVTPSDTTIVGARALWVGTGGNVAIQARGDDAAVVIKNVPSGTWLPISCARVMTTNTTASDIVALF